MSFSIEIISTKPKKIEGYQAYIGRITIDDFSEEFSMPIAYWSKDDYQKQWEEGLRRIHFNDYSCLVTFVQGLESYPLIFVWAMYKEDNKIYIRNNLLCPDTCSKLKKTKFTMDNCYDFIDKKRGHEPCSEWLIDISDLDQIEA